MAAIRIREAAIGALVGVLIASAAGLAWLFYQARDPTPEVNQAALDAAIVRWKAAGVKSYDLDVEIEAGKKSVVHLEVRDGVPTAMTRDGVAPKSRRAWDVWTIEGQFDMIQQELDKESDATQFGAPAGSTIIRRAAFDTKFGYPTVYHRQILGASLEVIWRNVRFQPVAGGESAKEALSE